MGFAIEDSRRSGMVAGHDVGLAMGAGKDHRKVRCEPARGCQCLADVQARYGQVGKDATCSA